MFILSCESAADISREHLCRRNIKYIGYSYELDGTEYRDDLGASMPFEEFYSKLRAGAMTKTSQININSYIDYFTPFLEEGNDIIHVTFSSGLSGTINSARNAALLLKEKYPEREIAVLDSLAASSGYGLLMDSAADVRDSGCSMSEVIDWIEENKYNLHHWFFSTDLTTYIRGGRISKAAGIFGGALQICPLMNMDIYGHLVPREKIRTKKRVIQEIVKRMAQHAKDGENYSGKVYISQSACYEDARAVADLIEAQFPSIDGKVEINWVGTTIGAHTGPDTVALFFFGDRRTE